MGNKFLEILFRPDETTCFAKHKQGTAVFDAFDPPGWGVFFSINPLADRRLDANVTSWRNFLLELDGGSLEDQRAYIDDIAVPWSTCVYSGGKSLHFVVALEESLADEAAYRALGSRLFAAVSRADQSTKNPSRLSRMPGRTRPDTRMEQELLEARARVPLAELQTWLGDYERRNPAAAPREYKQSIVADGSGGYRLIEPMHANTQRFLVAGAPQPGGIHLALRAAVFNLVGVGWPLEKIERDLLAAFDWRGLHKSADPEDIRQRIRAAYEWKRREDSRRAVSKKLAKGS